MSGSGAWRSSRHVKEIWVWTLTFSSRLTWCATHVCRATRLTSCTAEHWSSRGRSTFKELQWNKDHLIVMFLGGSETKCSVHVHKVLEMSQKIVSNQPEMCLQWNRNSKVIWFSEIQVRFNALNVFIALIPSIKHFSVFAVVIYFCLALCRFICVLDSVLPHLIPAWDYSLGTFNQIKVSHHEAFNIWCAQ